MTGRELAQPQALAALPPKILEEVLRQLRSTRNDIIRFAVWNTRNLSDEDFNRVDDVRLFSYFRQDLLETRFLSKGRRVDILELWGWFDDQLKGDAPMLLDHEEVFLNIQDKDVDKVRKRMSELRAFLPILRSDDLDGFRRIRFKLRRTVLRLTYDLHHLFKRLEKYRKSVGVPFDQRDSRLPLEAALDVPELPLDLIPPEEAVDA